MKKVGFSWPWLLLAAIIAVVIAGFTRSFDLDAILGRDMDATPVVAPTPNPDIKYRGCLPAILGPVFILLRLLLGGN